MKAKWPWPSLVAVVVLLAGELPLHAEETAPLESRLPELGEWWYAPWPTLMGESARNMAMWVDRLEQRRRECLALLRLIPSELRRSAAYVYRLRCFMLGGPPRGLPGELLNYYGSVGLMDTNLTCAVVRKAKAAPDLLGPAKLHALFYAVDDMRLLQGIAPAALLLGALSDKEIDDCRKRAIHGWPDDPMAGAVSDAEKDLERHRRRVEYGETWGPVGAFGVEFAILDLMGGYLHFSDDRWMKCVAAIRQAKDPRGIEALLKWVRHWTIEEPSDEPWHPEVLNRYPAMTALIEMGSEVPRWVALRLGQSPEYEGVWEDPTIVSLLVGIMGPKDFPAWLDELEKVYRANENFCKEDSWPLSRIRRLRYTFAETEFVPRYTEAQRFSGAIVRSRKAVQAEGPPGK